MFIYTCKNCGKVYETEKKRQKSFCSDSCREHYFGAELKRENREKRPKVMNCVICGKEFEPMSLVAKFCSYECSLENSKRNNRVPPKEIKCLHCGKLFIAKTKRRSYCSDRCKEKANKASKSGENLHSFRRIPNKVRRQLRATVFERDNGTCWLCKKKIEDDAVFEVHHLDITGREKDANNKEDNLVVLCKTCHLHIHSVSLKIADGKAYVHGKALELYFGKKDIPLA